MSEIHSAHSHTSAGLLRPVGFGYWRRRHHAKFLILLAAVMFACGVSIVVQSMYPNNRMLPFSYLGGEDIGLERTKEAEQYLTTQSVKAIRFKAGDKDLYLSLQDFGITYDTEASATAMSRYTWQERLVPFSILFEGRDRELESLVVRKIDYDKLRAQIDSLIAQSAQPVAEGQLSMKNGQAVLTDPHLGYEFTSSQIEEAVLGIGIITPAEFNVPVKVVEPQIPSSELANAAARAGTYATMDLTVEAAGKKHVFTKELVASWIRFIPDPANKQMKVEFDKVAIKDNLRELGNQLYIAPNSTFTTTYDGAEVSRTPGSNGRFLSYDATADSIVQALTDSTTTVNGTLEEIVPTTRRTRLYSATSQGLQTLLNDWVADHPGPRWGLVMKELGGQGRYAAVNPNMSFTTASVYKMFLTYPILSRVQSGVLDGNAVLPTGNTIHGCIDLMILRSSNPCGKAIGEVMGWTPATNDLNAKGYTSTKLNTPTGFITSANDTTKLLEDLYHGNYLSPENNARVLDLMRRQVFRNGIATGSSGPVANKVGYVDNFRHDVGIVYHPKGAYVLSALSYGGTYPQIVDLSRQISNYMNQ